MKSDLMKVSDISLVSRRIEKVGQLSSERTLTAYHLCFYWTCIDACLSPPHSFPSTFRFHGHLKYRCSASSKLYNDKKLQRKKNNMSLIFYSLQKRRKLACKKISVTSIHTVTSACLSSLLAHPRVKLKVVNYPHLVLFHLYCANSPAQWGTARDVFPTLP